MGGGSRVCRLGLFEGIYDFIVNDKCLSIYYACSRVKIFIPLECAGLVSIYEGCCRFSWDLILDKVLLPLTETFWSIIRHWLVFQKLHVHYLLYSWYWLQSRPILCVVCLLITKKSSFPSTHQVLRTSSRGSCLRQTPKFYNVSLSSQHRIDDWDGKWNKWIDIREGWLMWYHQ